MMFAANVAAMTPQELLQNLLNRAGLSPNALANELHAKGVRQPTLSRFLAGRVGDPRSSWMAPVAKRFNISEHALRDEEEATRVAQELGFAEGSGRHLDAPDATKDGPLRRAFSRTNTRRRA
jgi:hypothetical protein